MDTTSSTRYENASIAWNELDQHVESTVRQWQWYGSSRLRQRHLKNKKTCYIGLVVQHQQLRECRTCKGPQMCGITVEIV